MWQSITIRCLIVRSNLGRVIRIIHPRTLHFGSHAQGCCLYYLLLGVLRVLASAFQTVPASFCIRLMLENSCFFVFSKVRSTVIPCRYLKLRYARTPVFLSQSDFSFVNFRTSFKSKRVCL